MLGDLIAGLFGKVLDKAFPDANQKAEVAQALAQMQQAGEFKAIDAALQVAQIDAADRDSARKRQMETKDHTPTLLAVLILVGYGAVMYRLMTGGPLNADQQILWMMFGTLTAAVTQVLNYFLGSTSQSAAKNATIAEAIKAKGSA